MDRLAYSAAHSVAHTVAEHFKRHAAGRAPDAATIERLISAAFWASLRREEGRAPTISLAYLSPESAGSALFVERPLPLDPNTLTKLAPAVERPGIHLGVWKNGDDLAVWGATRNIPPYCFVVEVIEPGLLVIKHRRPEPDGKFANVAVRSPRRQSNRVGCCASRPTRRDRRRFSKRRGECRAVRRRAPAWSTCWDRAAAAVLRTGRSRPIRARDTRARSWAHDLPRGAARPRTRR